MAVAPTGYVDIDNDCEYSIDKKSTRSREHVDPKTDLAFYWDTYLVPKYSLNNINVNNVASFMKELEMNWTKLTPSLQENVMDIMVDSIFAKDSSFKTTFLQKLNPSIPPSPSEPPSPSGPPSPSEPPRSSGPFNLFKSSFGKSNFGKSNFGKSNFGMGSIMVVALIVIIALIMIFVVKPNMGGYPKFK